MQHLACLKGGKDRKTVGVFLLLKSFYEETAADIQIRAVIKLLNFVF